MRTSCSSRPLACSPTGEQFELQPDALAATLAIELRAAKLLYLAPGLGVQDAQGRIVRELNLAAATQLAATDQPDANPASHIARLRHAVHACRKGVPRSHLLDADVDGALLLELYTRDGVGMMIAADTYDQTRRATIDDIGGVLELIEPLEQTGELVRRSREKLEAEIEQFFVTERDGTIIACAGAYQYDDGTAVELACLAVAAAYRNQGHAERLLAQIEREARGQARSQTVRADDSRRPVVQRAGIHTCGAGNVANNTTRLLQRPAQFQSALQRAGLR